MAARELCSRYTRSRIRLRGGDTDSGRAVTKGRWPFYHAYMFKTTQLAPEASVTWQSYSGVVRACLVTGTLKRYARSRDLAHCSFGNSSTSIIFPADSYDLKAEQHHPWAKCSVSERSEQSTLCLPGRLTRRFGAVANTLGWTIFSVVKTGD